jgi:preprotein translocase subunit YajC
MLLNSILLQAAAAPTGSGLGSITSLLPLLIIVVVFYFFMIRPQMKKQKDQNKFRQEIKKGDKIVTVGGLHGKIAEVQDKTFIIEVEGGMRLKFEKSSVSMENSIALNKAE